MSNLTEEEIDQLMEIAGGTGLDGSNSITVLNELLALRVRNAKLEAALREARGWVIHFDNADGYQQHATLARIDAALLDPPQ
jgi:hypothetical protein